MKIFIFIVIIILAGCAQPSPPSDTKAVDLDSTKFFQVKDYFQGQINEVNKTPFFIYKIETSNGKKDSLSIDTKQFTELAKQFLQPDINDPPLKQFYRESIFRDETTNSYTLSYSTTNKTLPVQHIDVLLKDDAQSVKRIFIRRFYNYGDSSAIEQLSWKHGEHFQINRLVQTKDKKETSKQVIVVWNNSGNGS